MWCRSDGEQAAAGPRLASRLAVIMDRGQSPGTAAGVRQRSGLNAARISVANSSGSSQAAKWPPLLASWK